MPKANFLPDLSVAVHSFICWEFISGTTQLGSRRPVQLMPQPLNVQKKLNFRLGSGKGPQGIIWPTVLKLGRRELRSRQYTGKPVQSLTDDGWHRWEERSITHRRRNCPTP